VSYVKRYAPLAAFYAVLLGINSLAYRHFRWGAFWTFLAGFLLCLAVDLYFRWQRARKEHA
jgi:hypothetical protein